MITKQDVSTVRLSPTNKDFAQIWTELIDVASKISTRWDPVSTNESDPGIVLLKVLVGIADMLNYNIDKNILEAYMPSAAQIESMRMLCNMLGYNMKMYRSAETTITLDYTKASVNGDTPDNESNPGYALPAIGLSLPRFTVFYNDNKDVFYTSTNSEPILITNIDHLVRVPCIEGQVVQCESLNENNLITFANLTDDYRYYLPEVQIAENGIFIYNVEVDSATGDISSSTEAWMRVDNLNSMPQETKCFKVGYDSTMGLPYIEFNNDISNIIEDGLFVYYTRTSGANGNISANTITQFDAPSTDFWSAYALEHFTVTNPRATTNGANPETITEAYNGYKKVIGTFDTLVTCRDYMNKIYTLMDENNDPYVSNINVTDVNSDINNAVTICSCTNGGILYKAKSLSVEVDNSRNTTVGLTTVGLPDNTYRANIYNYPGSSVKDVPLLNSFELVLYPFNTFSKVNQRTSGIIEKYNKSFSYVEPKIDNVEFTTALASLLADVKTLAHTFRLPSVGDVVSINNYLRLDAVVSTANKVTQNEASAILTNIQIALANKFNMRNIDFGEQIPYDEILETIENADARIRVVSLQDPTARMYTKFAVKQNTGETLEYFVDSEVANECEPNNELNSTFNLFADKIYNKLAVRNILSGRVPLFKINNSFSTSFDEAAYIKRNPIDIEILPAALRAQLVSAKNALGKIVEPGSYPLVDQETGMLITATTDIDVVHPGATFEYHTFYRDNTSTVLSEEYVEVYEPYNSVFDNVTDIEINTEIPSTDGEVSDIPLEDGENIEFSAPNFATTMTYPAYVFYNFVSQHRNSESVAEYAKAVNLVNAIHSVGDDSASKNIDKKGGKFFANLWNSASKAGLLKEFYIINSDDEDKQAATMWEEESLDLKEYLNDAIRKSYRIGTVSFKQQDGSWFDGLAQTLGLGAKTASYLLETLLGVQTKPTAVSDVEYNSFTSADGVLDYLKDIKDQTSGKKIRFFHVPLQESTMQFWRNQLISAGNSGLISAPDYTPFSTDSTVLWRISGSGNVKSQFILDTGAKVLPQESKYFTDTSDRFKDTYLVTYPGKDPISYAIPQGSDYQLRPGEALYIHYTPSKTDSAGNSIASEPISKVYVSPAIIRPVGFDLQDTQLLYNRGGISWKKEDVVFPGPIGMNLMSLGASEQIEIREQLSVTIDEKSTSIANVYTNFDPTDKFVDVDVPVTASANADTLKKVKKYTLQDNEYFFYTDQNKASVAYYGSGSEIVLTGITLPSMSEAVDTEALLADSLQEVPFKSIDLRSTGASIVINENQFYTLVGGDTLKSLKLKSATSITNTPVECINDATAQVEFQLAGEDIITKLPRVDLIGASWKVACKTALLTSPVTVQTIRSDDSKIKNTITITNKYHGSSENSQLVEQKTKIEPDKNNPVSLKTNKVVQSANGSASFKDTENISLKIFSEGNSTITDFGATSMQTPVGIFTKFDLSGLAANGSVKLSAAIPENHFGIFSIYAHSDSDKLDGLRTLAGRSIDFPKSGSRAYIEVPKGMLNDICLINYECRGAGMSTGKTITDWWGVNLPRSSEAYAAYEKNPATTDLPEDFYFYCAKTDGDTPGTYKLFLRNGLNCIRINKSMTFSIKAEEAAAGELSMDTLKLVDASIVINQEQLRYRSVNNKSATDTLLGDIRAIDRDYDFYYSLDVENALSIDFNNSAHESLETPSVLYDVNNINRNFVVSKIDFDYLNKSTDSTGNDGRMYTAGGIRIARSSILR